MLRRAEAAALREYSSSDSDEMDLSRQERSKMNSKSSDEKCKNKRKVKRRYKRIISRAQKQKLKRSEDKKRQKITKMLEKYIGGSDVVEEISQGGRRGYVYKCPICKLFIKDKLNRHLVLSHKFDSDEALSKQSELRVLFLWCRSDKHNTIRPLPCKDCHEWFMRLDHHLIHHKKHKLLSVEDREKFIEDARSKTWQNVAVVEQVSKGKANQPTKETQNEESSDESSEDEKFVRRSNPIALDQSEDINHYVPEFAEAITDELRLKWDVKNKDFFTIWYKDSNLLLEAYYNDLMQTGVERNVAFQHRNHVELIWSTISKDLIMFPVNPLSNLHLFRDYYHYPSFQMIGKKNGVQASTLRSRYTSLTFFLQFLRKNQIYAGMSRSQLHLLDESITDFNKDLNPHIKQRKVDVRREKVRQLLLASHFVSYGRSEAIQNLLSLYEQHKGPSKNIRKKLSRTVAIQFRDYLIASLVIGNGLRASNIMELRMKDFEEYKIVKGYEGHKVIINDKYKTSTIYGEKFIVIPNALFDHYLFYIKYLRGYISDTTSNKVFLAASGQKKMSQSNVTTSLTASFLLAKVLKPNEYQRVSCSRIRCGIATFACNDGGFESGFFAKHFMKNREETTNMHYNLLSNRRHAIHIAMKLYQSFSCADGTKFDIDKHEVDKLMTNFTSLSKNSRSDDVIRWLLQHNPDVSKKELEDFKYILEDRNVDFETNTRSFYNSQQKVRTCDFM